MIRGERYFFFRLDRCKNDSFSEYCIARSFEDLRLRFGDKYLSSFYQIVQLNEVTIGHIRAINEFLLHQIS